MIGLLQRVTEARVEVGDATIAEIGIGLLVLVAIERGDTEVQAERLIDRLLDYRVFPDVAGKMNRSLQDIGGGLLLMPQFTLAADTRKGMRRASPRPPIRARANGCSPISASAHGRAIRSSLSAVSGPVCRSGSPMMGRSHSGCGQGPAARRPVRRPSLTTTERIWSHGSVR